ncbi:hypothetical protein [Nocardia sp. NPDC051832]|uniref:hypothetical protein n=1 Tax=Nocardia sp. NPDC051832 TaxID=3155673 RepID=UPI003411F97A
MAISKKGKRRIVVGDREFLWWVKEDWENYSAPGAPTLTIISANRRVVVRYVLAQSEENRHVVVLGPEFRGITRPGPHRRFRCPAFGLPGEVRPAHIAELISWCTETGDLPDLYERQVDLVAAVTA